MIPCCCKECVESVLPHYYSLDELKTRENRNKDTIECYRSYNDVSIQKLLLQVQIESDNTLKNSKENNVFISYSHKDSIWLDRISQHLKVLKKEGFNLDIWSDTKIKASQKWRDEIFKSLEKAKIGILLISTDFLASDFIIDNELPILLNHARSRGTEILPVIIKPSRFEKNKILAGFQAINKPSSPLSKLSNTRQEEVLVELTNRVEDILLQFKK
jgi:hypothetical protein